MFSGDLHLIHYAFNPQKVKLLAGDLRTAQCCVVSNKAGERLSAGFLGALAK